MGWANGATPHTVHTVCSNKMMIEIIHHNSMINSSLTNSLTHHLNGYFPGQPGLAPFPQSPVILKHSIITGQVKTFYTHTVLWALPCPPSEGVLKQKFIQAGWPSCHPINNVKAFLSECNQKERSHTWEHNLYQSQLKWWTVLYLLDRQHYQHTTR